MSKLIDTNVAIFLANRERTIVDRVLTFDDVPLISLLTRVELEGGVHVQAEGGAMRRGRVDALLSRVASLPFEADAVQAYADIVAVLGFSRRCIIDRLIAATAIVHDLVLVTTNGPNFCNIPGLKLEIWPRPEGACAQ